MRKTMVWVGSALLCGAVLAHAGERLFSYRLDTVRVNRVEVVDPEGRIRMVLTVHKDRPAITFYDAAGEPVPPTVVGEAGLVIGGRLE